MSDRNSSGSGLRERERPVAANRAGERRPGAVAAAGGPHRKRGILPWILGALALLAIGALLIGLLNGDDDSERAANAGQQAGERAEDAAAGAGAAGESATGGAAAGEGGSLTARGENILPPPSGGLGDYVGQDATGKDVVVQSVVQSADDPNQLEGFFVGTSQQDRVYVEWGGEVGTNEADYQPKVGEKVNLEGPVRPSPEDPARTLKLDEADAQVVKSQGGFVNADRVRPAE